MMIMIMGFGLMVILLITLVVGVSKVFLYQRQLHAVADGASLAATDGIDTNAIYGGGVGDRVVLSPASAHEHMAAYVAEYKSQPDSIQNFTCAVEVAPGGVEVTVGCSGQAELPFVTAATDGQGVVTVNVEATAQTFTS